MTILFLNLQITRSQSHHVVAHGGIMMHVVLSLYILLDWFGLCCLMTPGPSKDIRCRV